MFVSLVVPFRPCSWSMLTLWQLSTYTLCTIEGRNCRKVTETTALFWNWPLLYSCHFCCFMGMAAFPTQLQVRRCAKENLITLHLHKMRKELWEGDSDQTSQAVRIPWLVPFVGKESRSCVDWLTNSFAERIIKCKYLWITVYVVILFLKQTLLSTVAPVCSELKDFPVFIPFWAINCRE